MGFKNIFDFGLAACRKSMVCFSVPDGIDHCGFPVRFNVIGCLSKAVCVELFDKHDAKIITLGGTPVFGRLLCAN